MDLRVDPARWMHNGATGVFVRAIHEGRWQSVDIATLDAPSLKSWLRSRGGANEWAEGCVAILLGHETNEGPHRVVGA